MGFLLSPFFRFGISDCVHLYFIGQMNENAVGKWEIKKSSFFFLCLCFSLCKFFFYGNGALISGTKIYFENCEKIILGPYFL